MIEKKIIKEISEEMGLHPDIIASIVNDQLHFVKQTIEEGDYKGVKLDYLGRFVAKPRRLEFLRHMSEQKKLKQKRTEYMVFMDSNLLYGIKTTIPDWILASKKLDEIRSDWDQLEASIESLKPEERQLYSDKYSETERKFHELKQEFFRNLNKKMND